MLLCRMEEGQISLGLDGGYTTFVDGLPIATRFPLAFEDSVIHVRARLEALARGIWRFPYPIPSQVLEMSHNALLQAHLLVAPDAEALLLHRWE